MRGAGVAASFEITDEVYLYPVDEAHVTPLMRSRHRFTDDGFYIMNVIDGGESGYARAQLATLREHFDHVAVMLPPDGVPANGAANLVLIASDAPMHPFEVDPADGVLLDGAATETFIGDAVVLRDDFAPVDQLTQNF